MKTPKLLHHLRGAWCGMMSASLILGGIATASAFNSTTRGQAYGAWKSAFYYTDSHGGRFRNQQGANANTSFWQGAEMIEVVEDAVASGVDITDTANQLCRSYTNDNSLDWSWNSFNDDLGWASMAFSRAYALTGNTVYRTCAKNAADEAWSRGWDTVNGGMYQQNHTGSKCTCANAPNGDASYMLYQSLGTASYKTRAQQELSWMEANVYDASTGNVIEGPGAGNPSFSYDSGGFATLAFWLGNPTEANKAGDWVQSHWGTSMQSFGQGSDAGGFNGICLRGLARTGHNLAYLQACCDKAWTCRNNVNLTSVNFGSTTPSGTSLWCWDCTDMVAGMMCTPAAPASITSGQIYQLEPKNALGMRLDVTAGGGSGSKMEIYTSNNGNSQKFQVNAISGEYGVYQLVPQCSTSSRLDVVSGGISPGTLTQIYTANGGLNQSWAIIPVDEANHVYMLAPQNAATLRLDVIGNGTANGTGVDIWTANGGSVNQLWIFH
jgi:hypothetical protein